MLTRCPHCQTAFRVLPEQLKARNGQVRCGTCRDVFNALDSLSDEILTAPTATMEVQVPETIPEPAVIIESELPPTAEEVDTESVAVAEAITVEAVEEVGPATAEPEQAIEEDPVEEVWEEVEEIPPPRRWPWISGALILLMLAAAQLLFIFRVELAVLSPELRPALVAGCELIGCVLPRPRKPELLGIETSDLAPASSDQLIFTATLKNRAPFDQEYPHLELTLTDMQDAALLRKVLTPADYLPAGQPATAGFAARGELAVKLTFEARGVPAIGYRLYLFYP
jgi:predicted Zn finger-like uncharacterized protein